MWEGMQPKLHSCPLQPAPMTLRNAKVIVAKRTHEII